MRYPSMPVWSSVAAPTFYPMISICVVKGRWYHIMPLETASAVTMQEKVGHVLTH